MPLLRPDSTPPEKTSTARSNSKRGTKNDLPIGQFYKLLDAREYVHTEKRLIALCALEGPYGKELKLYQWEWKGDQKGWKVGLANLKVENLNLGTC
jgi:hypothetical protein